MNKNLKYTLQTLSVAAIILSFAWIKKSFYAANKTLPANLKSDTEITIIHYIDSSTHIVNQVSKISYRDRPGKQPLALDTQAIIKRYFTRRFTENSYRDSNLSLTVFDTLFQNAIIGRSFSYKIFRPNTVITKTVSNRSNGLYIGAGYLPQTGIYPTVSCTFKNWQLGAGLVVSAGKSIPLFNLQYKIR